MNRRANQKMRKKSGSVEKQSKNYLGVVLLNDDTSQQSQNSCSEKVQNEVQYSKVKKADKSAFILPKAMVGQRISRNELPSDGANHSKAMSRGGEVSCEISDTDITDTEQSPSFTASKINPSTASTSVSIKTMINEINEIFEEISSKIQNNATLTNERLNRIKRYFTESTILTSYELDAFEWITDNIQSIYNDPINSCKKLRTAMGNRTIPINIAIEGLRLFVKDHTISKNDMKKYCCLEGRNEITINELSEILKRLIKMRIKHILFDESDSISAIPIQKSSRTYQF